MFYDFFMIFFRAENINLIEKHFNSLQFVDLINFIEKSLRYGIIKIQLNVERLRIAKSEARSNNLWVFSELESFPVAIKLKIFALRFACEKWALMMIYVLLFYFLCARDFLFLAVGLFHSCNVSCSDPIQNWHELEIFPSLMRKKIGW